MEGAAHALRVALMPRQRLSVRPTLLGSTSGNTRAPQIFHSMILAIEYLVPMPRLHSFHTPVACLIGELLRDPGILTVRMFGIVVRIRLR